MTETRVALVTGANRGIGLEIVRQLSRLGVVAVIAARDVGKGNQAAAELRSEVLIRRSQLDVSDPASRVASPMPRSFMATSTSWSTMPAFCSTRRRPSSMCRRTWYPGSS
jgi:NADP-dependent 3-hydroxy acid dehydrogenase YdfG